MTRVTIFRIGNDLFTTLLSLSLFPAPAAHNCQYYCVINCWPAEHSKTFNKNPLRLPEICGWSRELAKMKGSGKRHVVYRAPCGRMVVRFIFGFYQCMSFSGCGVCCENAIRFLTVVDPILDPI